MKLIILSVALGVVASSIPCSAQLSAQVDPWSVLNRITHKRTYQVEARDGKCFSGTIRRVADDNLKLELQSSPSTVVVFPRNDVLRVSTGPFVYYSSRSSWQDVRTAVVKWRDSLRIVMDDGNTYQVRAPFDVSDTSIKLQTSGKSVTVEKAHVSKVYYVVAKPLSDRGEYAAQELGPMIVFDPDVWAYGLHLEQYVSVPLYDASKPEDNSLLECKSR